VDKPADRGYNHLVMAEQDTHCEVLISREEIATAVDRLAAEISRDYGHKRPLLVAVLKGAFVFLADLMRRLDFPLEVDFIRLSSYGSGQESSGEVRVVHGLGTDVAGRHVLVVEDIIDTGLTTAFLLNYLKEKGAASVRLCALTDKPSRRQVAVNIDYLGFTVPDKFLVGYGIDWDERFRYLPDICYVGEE
jgi:hypoxanthine phosphoribosyltransferase